MLTAEIVEKNTKINLYVSKENLPILNYWVCIILNLKLRKRAGVKSLYWKFKAYENLCTNSSIELTGFEKKQKLSLYCICRNFGGKSFRRWQLLFSWMGDYIPPRAATAWGAIIGVLKMMRKVTKFDPENLRMKSTFVSLLTFSKAVPGTLRNFLKLMLRIIFIVKNSKKKHIYNVHFSNLVENLGFFILSNTKDF